MAESYAQKHPVNEILSSVLFEAVQDLSLLIQDEVLPPVDVSTVGRTGTLLIENDRNLMGSPDADDLRAPGAERKPITSHIRTTTTYTCDIRCLSDAIPMEDIEDSQFPGDEEERMVRRVGRSLRLKREDRVAQFFMSGAPAWTTVAQAAIPGGSGLQVNVAGATPAVDWHLAHDIVRGTSNGVDPSDMIIPYDVVRACGRNLELRGYVGDATLGVSGGGDRVMPTSAILAVLAQSVGNGSLRIHVGAMRHETAVKGVATAQADQWTDTVWIGLLPGPNAVTVGKSRVRVEPAAAVSFSSMGWVGGMYDTLDLTARHVWAEYHRGDTVINLNRGLRISNVLA